MINASNAASQDLDPSTNTVINRAEYFGSRLYVTASGTYQALVSKAVSHCTGFPQVVIVGGQQRYSFHQSSAT